MPSGKDIWNIWEPSPYDAARSVETDQRQGFEVRARWSLEWKSVRDDWPDGESVFGKNLRWFIDCDAECFCSFRGEDLILTYSLYAWFPDPPPWGLFSRPSDQHDAKWQTWGYFGCLPNAWLLPKLGDWVRPTELRRVAMPGVDSADDT